VLKFRGCAKALKIGTGCMMLFAGAAMAQQNDTIITKQYEEGGVYEGTFKDGKQHGTGTYRLPNGYEYTGEWVEGEISGQGMAKFPNGSIYEGSFANGKPHGRGKITFADGSTYEGDWVEGKINGTGVVVYSNGVRYEGAFKDAQPHGKGRMESPNRYVYEGDWATGSNRARGVWSTPTVLSMRATSRTESAKDLAF